MKRSTLDVLRCVVCAQGHLAPELASEQPRILFGPVECAVCKARYPVGEGLIDLVGERAAPKGIQGQFESAWLARSYEKYVRPSFELLLTRGGFDRDSEY